MHAQGESTQGVQGQIVPYEQLHRCLTEHITQVEMEPDPEVAADSTDEFLDFVKGRAGLLIEIGENQYSFIHLTFQEYLTASYIRKQGQLPGAKGIWEMIADCYAEPQWREVIRLLVAELEEEVQAYLIEQILNAREAVGTLQLLEGLLLDGIEPTEEVVDKMIRYLLSVASTVTEITPLRTVTSILQAWRNKREDNADRIADCLYALIREVDDDTQRMALALLAPALNLPESEIARLGEQIPTHVGENAVLFKPFFLTHVADSDITREFRCRIERVWVLEDILSLSSLNSPFIAVAYRVTTGYFGHYVAAKRTFEMSMATLIYPSSLFLNFVHYTLSIATNQNSVFGKWPLDRNQDRDKALSQNKDLNRTLDLDWALARALDLDLDMARALDRVLALARARVRAQARILDLDLDWVLDLDLALSRDSTLYKDGNWQTLLAQPDIVKALLDILCQTLKMEPRLHWREAFRLGFLPNVPQRIDLFDEAIWKKTWLMLRKSAKCVSAARLHLKG
jgi:hypothetical protein